MANHVCKYHPENRASWLCRSCQIEYCSTCIGEVENGEASCPICKQPLIRLGKTTLTPFWHRISTFFLYPLHIPPLLLILMLTGFNSLALGRPAGFLLQLGILFLFVKYFYVVMVDTAASHLKPRRIEWSMFSEDLELPFKLLFIIFVYAALTTLTEDLLGESLYMLILLFSVLLFPASVMLLAVKKSFLRAINPYDLLKLIKNIGIPYLLLCGFLFLLVGGLWTSNQLVLPMIPLELYIPISMIITMYFILVMSSMMGYVLYQYHEILGYGEYIQVQKIVEIDTGNISLGQKIEILLKEGKFNEAVEELNLAIAQHPSDFNLRERLHRLVISIGNKEMLKKYSADYIARLLVENRQSEAIRVFMECYKLDSGFKPEGAKNRYELAGMLVKSGQSRAALSLLNDLHKDYPSYEGIPDAYLLVARIMFEYFNEEEKAKKILQYLSNKYPHHPTRKKVLEYLDVLNSISNH